MTGNNDKEGILFRIIINQVSNFKFTCKRYTVNGSLVTPSYSKILKLDSISQILPTRCAIRFLLRHHFDFDQVENVKNDSIINIPRLNRIKTKRLLNYYFYH